VRIVIIANPRSGRGRTFLKLQQHIRAWPHRGWDVELLATRAPGHAAELAHGLQTAPPDVLAVCGGDGTFNEVVNGAPAPACPVAIIPAGTGNVLARDLGMPLNPERALAVALDRRVRHVDVCRLDGACARHFILMAGVGFDAHVVAHTPPAAKGKLGIATFYFSSLISLATYRFPELRIDFAGESIPAVVCIVANSKGYGGGLALNPEADMADGLVDVLALQTRSRFGLARFVLSALRGKPADYPWVRRFRTRSLRIEGPPDVGVQADGELVGTLPVEISLKERSFPLVIPGPAGRI